MVKGSTIKSIDRSAGKIYFEKAREFYESMLWSFERGQWNTVGLTAVHCAISISDALLAHFGGVRNTSQDHQIAGRLLKDYIKDKAIQEQEKHYIRIISKKNLVEYEGRVFVKKDAEDIKIQTERFYSWARQKLQ